MSGLNVGIELELENTSPGYRTAGWAYERDGTLREDGVEFLLNGKKPVEMAKTMTRELLTHLGSNFTTSHRCSTHIHVDIQSLPGYSKVAMLLGLIIHDDWFFQYGKGRERNHFCCPVLRSPAALTNINRAIRSPDWDARGRQKEEVPVMRRISQICEANTKYMSINTMPMNSLGTIELRHFDPITSADDMDVILDRLSAIYQVAAKVPKAGRRGCIEAWAGFDKTLTEEITWTTAMYDTHNRMVGV